MDTNCSIAHMDTNCSITYMGTNWSTACTSKPECFNICYFIVYFLVLLILTLLWTSTVLHTCARSATEQNASRSVCPHCIEFLRIPQIRNELLHFLFDFINASNIFEGCAAGKDLVSSSFFIYPAELQPLSTSAGMLMPRRVFDQASTECTHVQQILATMVLLHWTAVIGQNLNMNAHRHDCGTFALNGTWISAAGTQAPTVALLETWMNALTCAPASAQFETWMSAFWLKHPFWHCLRPEEMQR